MIDLRELLDLLEDAEEELKTARHPVPSGLDTAISRLHQEIHKDG